LFLLFLLLFELSLRIETNSFIALISILSIVSLLKRNHYQN
jgi:hypothetical protein